MTTWGWFKNSFTCSCYVSHHALSITIFLKYYSWNVGCNKMFNKQKQFTTIKQLQVRTNSNNENSYKSIVCTLKFYTISILMWFYLPGKTQLLLRLELAGCIKTCIYHHSTAIPKRWHCVNIASLLVRVVLLLFLFGNIPHLHRFFSVRAKMIINAANETTDGCSGVYGLPLGGVSASTMRFHHHKT